MSSNRHRRLEERHNCRTTNEGCGLDRVRRLRSQNSKYWYTRAGVKIKNIVSEAIGVPCGCHAGDEADSDYWFLAGS
jgi:hypothetical protein